MQYYRTQGGGFLNSIPPATKNLIFINILVYIATIINKDFMFKSFALFYPTSPFFHWWQLLTHMFMHGNFWHLFFNMYSLFIFGSTVERTIGTKKFLILYFVAGFGAVALHFGVMNIQTAVLAAQVRNSVDGALQAFASIKMVPTVGASGAIYGLLLSYALLHPQNRLTLIFPPITLSAKTWVIIFAVIELFTGVSGVSDGVAHFAHLGGMLFAWGLISYWKKKRCLYDDYMN